MRIGELAQRTGASIRSLRYYEDCGLIAAERSVSGQRRYDETAIAQVVHIRELLAAGLSTNTIADVLPCIADPSAQTSRLTSRLIAERDRLAAEIAQRTATQAALQQIIDTAPPLNTSTDQSSAAIPPMTNLTY
ncbi:MAG: MerR family DNA-binding transcriptional regulator [Microbacteriaceae bacterium]|nr:MerR family DNA-binding transcriptional regulator [Microbacteriaceae bacterium]